MGDNQLRQEVGSLFGTWRLDSIIVDIRGRIVLVAPPAHQGGMLTGSSGKIESSDMTYAIPFWCQRVPPART